MRGREATFLKLADLSPKLSARFGICGLPGLSGGMLEEMGRNLYILAATLGGLSLLSIVLSFTNIADQPGSPGDAGLWRMTSIALFVVALVITLAGVLSSLFEQAERRHEEQRRRQREARRGK